jgi:hypothetical protein
LKRFLLLALPVFAVMLLIVSTNSQAEDTEQAEAFPQGEHILWPQRWTEGGEWRVAYGAVDPEEELEQPIAYSHKLHAGELGIDCQYCHANARRSPHAGVPPPKVCMNCHAMISNEGRPELVKLKEYFDGGEPIPWVKVHDLPDFVHFSHKRHVRGGVECQECHGEVQDDFTVAKRVSELTMGWCLDCHEDHPKVDENYGAMAELRRAEIKDCYTCHK